MTTKEDTGSSNNRTYLFPIQQEFIPDSVIQQSNFIPEDNAAEQVHSGYFNSLIRIFFSLRKDANARTIIYGVPRRGSMRIG
jgi:hypothetical protein